MTALNSSKMQYRYFGNTGLKVSQIGFGNMINYKPENAQEDEAIVKMCIENGINLFDTAEIYADGKSQIVLGNIIKKLGVERQSLVICTKVGSAPDPDQNSTLSTNRKHIKESVKKSLKRLQMDYVDVIYAHAFDNDTPMEEICRGFHEVVEEGEAFYWATSNWPAEMVFRAFQICEKYNLHKPIGGQHQYNMLVRTQIESEYEHLFSKYSYGMIAYSPLAGGYLSGKHIEGIKEDQKSRLTQDNEGRKGLYKMFFFDPYHTQKNIDAIKQLKKFAEDFGAKLVHLAIAWVMKFSNITSALVGARNTTQLQDTLKAFEVLEKLTPEVEGKINKILSNHPEVRMDFENWKPFPPVRPIAQ